MRQNSTARTSTALLVSALMCLVPACECPFVRCPPPVIVELGHPIDLGDQGYEIALDLDGRVAEFTCARATAESDFSCQGSKDWQVYADDQSFFFELDSEIPEPVSQWLIVDVSGAETGALHNEGWIDFYEEFHDPSGNCTKRCVLADVLHLTL